MIDGPASNPKPHSVRFGVFEADLQAGELRKQGIRVKLSPKAFELLGLLLNQPNELVTRAELRSKLWGDVVVEFDHAVHNTVNAVRTALGDSAANPRFIETVPKRGYRFIAPVTAAECAEGALRSSVSGFLPRSAYYVAALGMLLAFIGGASRYFVRARAEANRKVVTKSRPAEDAYLTGLYYMDRMDQASQSRAHSALSRAVELEPNHAPALSALAVSYGRMAAVGLLPSSLAYEKSTLLAKHSLQIDHQQALAHVALATATLRRDRNWKGSEQELRLALAQNPKLALAHIAYALLLVSRGQFPQALLEAQQARVLAPTDIGIQTTVGVVFYCARDYERAAAQLRMVVDMDPAYAPGRKYLSDVYVQLGQLRTAAEQLEAAFKFGGVPIKRASQLSRTLAESGTVAFAKEMLRAGRQASAQWSPVKLAGLYAASGQPEKALDLLSEAYEQCDPRIQFLGVDPEFDALRTHARFRELLQRAGITANLTLPVSWGESLSWRSFGRAQFPFAAP